MNRNQALHDLLDPLHSLRVAIADREDMAKVQGMVEVEVAVLHDSDGDRELVRSLVACGAGIELVVRAIEKNISDLTDRVVFLLEQIRD
jgi:hypothetical protein